MGLSLPYPKLQFFDTNGDPLVGGKLFTRQVGGVVNKGTFTTPALGVANANPVILDQRGEAGVFSAGGELFHLTLQDASGVTLWQVDGVEVPVSGLTQAYLGGVLFPRVSGEISAGVTPVAYQYSPGDVRRYGTNTTPGTTIMGPAIQASLDSVGYVNLQKETYQISTAILMDDSEQIYGLGRDTKIRGALATGLIKSRTGLTTRRYYLGGRNFTIDNTSKATVGGIGLDMSGVTMAKWFDVGIVNVATGVKQLGSGAVGCFYNEFHAVDINGVTTGYNNGTLANENKVFGGRVNDCVTGTIDDDNSCNSYFGLAIEAFTTGHSVSPTAASLLTRFIGSRLENAPTVGTGILVGATAQDTFIESPYCVGLTADITDGGLRSTVLFPRGGGSVPIFKFNGGSNVKKISCEVVNQAVAILATVTARQDAFTVSGVAVGDKVTVTLPASWPNGLLCSPPIVAGANDVRLQLYNTTGGDISIAASDFVFEVIDYT